MLHAKTAVIDGAWSTIGSANIDRRSFIHNYELNVVVLDPAFGAAMESAFNEDLRDSKEVTLERWRAPAVVGPDQGMGVAAGRVLDLESQSTSSADRAVAGEPMPAA